MFQSGYFVTVLHVNAQLRSPGMTKRFGERLSRHRINSPVEKEAHYLRIPRPAHVLKINGMHIRAVIHEKLDESEIRVQTARSNR